MQIISNNAVSHSVVNDNILTYVNSVDEYANFIATMDATAITMLFDIISGYGTWRTYKSAADRNEEFLYSALLPSSIYSKARQFGYNLSRATAPVVTVVYDGTETLTVKTWDKFGTTEQGYSLYYTGKESLTIEKGDSLSLSIGQIGLYSAPAVLIDGMLSISVATTVLSLLDNDSITLSINGFASPLSKMLEEYVIYSSAIDFSLSPAATTIEICDIKNAYGVKGIEDGDVVNITWLETNGYEKVAFLDLKLDERFVFSSFTYYGSDGDSSEKTRQLAPLFFSTIRRAVTPQDHKYVIEASPYILSCFVESDPGVPWVCELSIPDIVTPGAVYSLTLSGNLITYTALSSDTKESVLDYFFGVLSYNTYTFVERLPNSVKLTEKNAKFHMTLEMTDNLLLTTIVEYVKPNCCTANVHYVHSNIKNGQETLSEFEKTKLVEYMSKFKVVGVYIDWIPATSLVKTLDFTITLNDITTSSLVLDEINLLIDSYQYIMGGSFSSSELITSISKISVYTEQEGIIQPIVNVLPTFDLFDCTADQKEYLKFNSTVRII